MKKVFWFRDSLILLVAIAVGLMFSSCSEKTDQIMEPDIDPTVHIELLKLDSAEDVENYAVVNEMILQEAEDGSMISLGDVPFMGQKLTLYFQKNERGDLTRVDAITSVSLQEKTEDCLKKAFMEICHAAALIFDIPENFTYSIYSNEGYELDIAAEESYHKILKGQAKFGLSAVDYDRTYWKAEAYLESNNILQLSFFHSFDTDMYESGVENIILVAPLGAEE